MFKKKKNKARGISQERLTNCKALVLRVFFPYGVHPREITHSILVFGSLKVAILNHPLL